MNLCDHLLSKHGIMCNFSIAKKVTQQRLNQLIKELNVENMESEVFQERLKKDMIKETQIAYYNNSIPGVITNLKEKTPNQRSKSMSADSKKKVAMLTTLFLSKMVEKKLSKDELCLMLIQIINGLGLQDTDFKMFHDKYPDDIDDDDDDYYDEEEDEND